MQPHERKQVKNKFIEALKKEANVTTACQVAGIDRKTSYRWRKDDSKFAEEWDSAVEVSNDVIRRAIFGRAVDGWEEPLVSAGKIVRDEYGNPMGIRKYSDPLLQFLARSRMKEFREKQELDVTGSMKIFTEWGNSALEDEDDK